MTRALSPGFQKRVYAVVRLIPKGRVATYGDVAFALGHARVARHVGFALSRLEDKTVPWHRVVNAQGRVSLDETGPGFEQQKRLVREGVAFTDTGRIQSFKTVRLDRAALHQHWLSVRGPDDGGDEA